MYGSCDSNHNFCVYQMTHLMSVLSYTWKGAGCWEAKRLKSGEKWSKIVRFLRKDQMPSSLDLIITPSVSLKPRGEKREYFDWCCLCVENQINCGEICTILICVMFVIPGRPSEHPPSKGLTRPWLSCPVPAGQLTGLRLVFTAVTLLWHSMHMYRTDFPWLENKQKAVTLIPVTEPGKSSIKLSCL